MTKCTLSLFFFAALLFSACKPAIKPGDLYGKWNYTKLEKPNANPPSVEPDWKLKIEKPYIEFSKNNDLIIMWGGKILSHGKFITDGKNIRYTESLPDGKTREFPFWVMKLTDKEIVFETLGQDGSMVTATKQ